MSTHPEVFTEDADISIIPQNITLEELLERMVEAGLPVEEYGIGTAKPVGKLLSEVQEGEAVVTVDRRGNMTRAVNVLWLEVLCSHSDGNVYHLKEDRQVSTDGIVRRRELDSSIGEKIKPGEDLVEAAGRGIEEELGITEIVSLHELGFVERTFTPDTFPGLESTYRMHKMAAVIPESAFDPDGYVEMQADKTNYYVWERADSIALQ